QAEDGIRDRNVTGVQTCALPISGDPLQENGAGDHVQRPVRVHGWLGVNVVAALASLREVPSQYGAGSLRRNVLLSRIDGGGDGPDRKRVVLGRSGGDVARVR